MLMRHRWGVYFNWFRLDPWFLVRYYIRDFFHPRSPLSSTSLVHKAFFSDSFPRESVKEFETQMPEYESMLWPFGMMFTFVNVANVIRSIVGWKGGREQGGKRMLIMAGEKDTLMGVSLMRQMAAMYRIAAEKMGFSDGVGFEVVSGSGHHIQNDLHWEEGARVILEFVDQV
jgi:pimeloyl-ACP methyl ester carboxylesterase